MEKGVLKTGITTSRSGTLLVEVVPDGTSDRAVGLRFEFGDIADRNQFVSAMRDSTALQKIRSSALRILAASQTTPRADRKLLQARVAPELLLGLQLAKRQANARSVGDLIRDEMEEWIDFGTGMRRRGNRPKTWRRPTPLKEFQELGRKLARPAGSALVQVNVGSAKKAVKQLIKRSAMRPSSFVSALIHRICTKRGIELTLSHDVSGGAASDPDG